MKSKKGILAIVIAFVVLLGGATVLYNKLQDAVDSNQLAETTGQNEQETSGEESQEQNSETGENEEEASSAAPDFTVIDYDGNEVHLSDYLGKPVILNFWASWCGPCKSEMPDFEEAYKGYGDDIQFMMINLTDGSQETFDGASGFIKEQGYTFPVFYDITYSAAGQYVYSGIPITYFIDAEGNFVAYGQGALDAEALQSGIDMLLE